MGILRIRGSTREGKVMAYYKASVAAAALVFFVWFKWRKEFNKNYQCVDGGGEG